MKIAVATDFSDYSREAFGPAAALGRKLSADLYVVHLQQGGLFWTQPSAAAALEALKNKLDEMAAEPCFDGLEVEPILLPDGGLHAFAAMLESRDIDLLVIATHGRRGVKRFLLGSFAEKIIRVAPCPVFVSRENAQEGVFEPARILVAHDLSKCSEAASDMACDWARRFSSTVRLLHVVDPRCDVSGLAADVPGFGVQVGTIWIQNPEAATAEAERQLRHIRSEKWSEVESDIEVVSGYPALEIVARAAAFEADVVVLGTHGVSGVDRVLLGSVAERVARETESSVLLVRATDG